MLDKTEGCVTPDEQIAQFTKERNEAFLSLDEKTIREMQRKWNGTEMPDNMEVFWGAVHKAITGVQKGLPLEFRKKSKAWLTERGYESMDDGEL